MMSKPITLFDFNGNASPLKAWNYNVWKARYVSSHPAPRLFDI